VVEESLGRAGRLGLTIRQICEATDVPLRLVEDVLEELNRAGLVERVGRGLWILRGPDGTTDLDPQDTPGRYEEEFGRWSGLALGEYRGSIQFGPNERLPVHRWWPYVQGFSAEFVDATLQEIDLGPRPEVLDPFCGSGTVLVVGRQRGARALGIEYLPIAAKAARTKQLWDVSAGRLRREAEDLDRRARSLADLPGVPFLRETRRQFSSENLTGLRRLRGALQGLRHGLERELLEIAFARILIEASRLTRAPCLGYRRGRAVRTPPPRELFRKAVEEMAEDLELLQADRPSWGPPASVREEDARTVELPPERFSLAITSPPYVNGLDYVMNYKLEMAWLGLVGSYSDLRRLKSDLVACDNVPRHVISTHRPGPEVEGEAWLTDIRRRMGRHLESKGSYRRRDMDRVVAKYFDDLVPVIRRVYRSLRPGGRFVVVNGDSYIAGTYIPSDLIFARLAANVGFEVESVLVARHRRSGQHHRFDLRESVLTLRKVK